MRFTLWHFFIMRPFNPLHPNIIHLRLMNKNSYRGLISCLLGGALVSWMLSIYGCASIGAPMGGPKDSLPPVLEKANPLNFTPNFNAKTITLEFDEFVDVANVFEKLIINPPLNKFPVVERKLRTVTIRIKDTLEKNTTYSWRFDDVIKDVNEGNPFGNYTYVFSTGPTFDSATFSGRVIGAQTGKVDSTLIVVLHRDLSDTAIVKTKPRYVTKLDSAGVFRFSYLAPGRYNVFALKDEGMKRYSDSSIPFAFHNEVVEVSENTPPVKMLYFVAKERVPEKPSGTESVVEKKEGETQDKDKKPQTLSVRLSQESQGSHDILKDLHLQFNRPVKTIDSSLIVLTDTNYRAQRQVSVKLDSSGKELIISHPWKLGMEYLMIFKKGFAFDSAGLTSKQDDTLQVRAKGESDYGLLKIQFSGLNTEDNPVLQFVENNNIYKSVPLTSNTFLDRLFKPGQYELRILFDLNKNGIWDTGDYYTRRQPEQTIDLGQKITVRGNWDNELDVTVNRDE